MPASRIRPRHPRKPHEEQNTNSPPSSTPRGPTGARGGYRGRRARARAGGSSSGAGRELSENRRGGVLLGRGRLGGLAGERRDPGGDGRLHAERLVGGT